MSINNPLTQPGIEPATFRLAAQHLNHCATAAPHFECSLLPKHVAKPLLQRDVNTDQTVNVKCAFNPYPVNVENMVSS
jgi:hypothetical protein